MNAEFFFELAAQRALGRLARLDLSARKLPLEAVPLARGALANEHLPVTLDNRRDDCRHGRGTQLTNVKANNCRPVDRDESASVREK